MSGINISQPSPLQILFKLGDNTASGAEKMLQSISFFIFFIFLLKVRVVLGVFSPREATKY